MSCLQLGQELGVGDALPAFGVHLMIRNWMAGTADTVGDLPEQAAAYKPALPRGGGDGSGVGPGGGGSNAARLLREFRARRPRYAKWSMPP